MAATYEEMLAFVLAQLAVPVGQHDEPDGAVVVTSGEPGDVIVRLTDTQVTVAEYSVVWHTPETASVEPIAVGMVIWSAVSAEAAMRVVKGLIAAAREARRAKFRVCGLCERSTPPEWMQSDDICQECTEQDPGVVH